MHVIKNEFEAYGWRRMQATLRQEGRVVNHKKFKRLIREHGLNPVRRRRFVVDEGLEFGLLRHPEFPSESDVVIRKNCSTKTTT